MAKPKATVPGANKPKEVKHTLYSNVFRSTSQILFFVIFCLWIPVSIAEIGLTGYEIHKRGRPVEFWPGYEFEHAVQLGLFSGIISILFGITHWWFSLNMYLPITIMIAVWQGVTAGIIYESPYGHGLKCGLPIERIPEAYQKDFGDCKIFTAISATAWSMFGLSLLCFFLTFSTKFKITSVRNIVYDIEMTQEQKEARGLDQMEKAEGSH